ncbi:MarR family winged helix-turn-helix transcriptional regulator [Dyella acidiphila]|uniref:MarR family transcriptional regulator n=1 Tax=Dyella acidiphila TaxID=2775866 RepID=A0ABR9GA63_9GAMM|nr:MarR family transcriptional regulator [Dyella acidiphila]MBE1160922.1 MarR family transcriptional regulator [Dyella acidiphila]
MPRPAQPHAALESAVSDLTVAVGQLLRRLRSQTDPSDLNLSQHAVLSRLDQQGAMTTAELARAESMKPQSMGAILASLEQEGMVARQPHPTDGRQILFALTAGGTEVRRQRGLAKRAWLLAAMGTLEPEELQTVIAAIPLIKRLGES